MAEHKLDMTEKWPIKMYIKGLSAGYTIMGPGYVRGPEGELFKVLNRTETGELELGLLIEGINDDSL